MDYSIFVYVGLELGFLQFFRNYNSVTYKTLWLFKNLLTLNFCKFSTFLNFALFCEGAIWHEVVIQLFVKIRFLRLKSKTLLEFELNWPSYIIFYRVLCLIPFTADVRYIYYVFMTSNLRFHDFLPKFQCARQKIMTLQKRPVYF